MLLVSAVLGFWWGFLVTTIGTTIGMLLSFLVGKQIFRDRLHRYIHSTADSGLPVYAQGNTQISAAGHLRSFTMQGIHLACLLLDRWVAGNRKAEAMLLAISEAGTFKVPFRSV